MAELFEDRQFRQGLGHVHIALQGVPEGQRFFQVHAQGLDFSAKKHFDRGVAMVQPYGETAIAMRAGAKFQGGIELIEGRAKRLLKAPADGAYRFGD